jgi:IstB-like ATP binding protein
MLLTTNQMVGQWGGVFGDDVLAAAILDRLPSRPSRRLLDGSDSPRRHGDAPSPDTRPLAASGVARGGPPPQLREG